MQLVFPSLLLPLSLSFFFSVKESALCPAVIAKTGVPKKNPMPWLSVITGSSPMAGLRKKWVLLGWIGCICSVKPTFFWYWNSCFWRVKHAHPLPIKDLLHASEAAVICLPTQLWKYPATFSSEKLTLAWSFRKSSCLRYQRVYPISRWSWSNPLFLHYLYSTYIYSSSAYVTRAHVIPDVNS